MRKRLFFILLMILLSILVAKLGFSYYRDYANSNEKMTSEECSEQGGRVMDEYMLLPSLQCPPGKRSLGRMINYSMWKYCCK